MITLIKKLMKKISKAYKETIPSCSDCERRGTMDCTISYMCYSTEDKPYFKSRHNGK